MSHPLAQKGGTTASPFPILLAGSRKKCETPGHFAVVVGRTTARKREYSMNVRVLGCVVSLGLATFALNAVGCSGANKRSGFETEAVSVWCSVL